MATYVPNATEVTQPTSDKFVFSAAEEFRTLRAYISTLAGAIGTGSAAVGGVVIPDQTMTAATPAGKIVFTDTNPLSWHLGAGSMYLRFEFITDRYFEANPNGHFAVVLRCDTGLVATEVRGQGCAIGNLTGALEGTTTNPGAQLETYHGTLLPTPTTRYLIPNAATALGKPLLDGTVYRVEVESVLTAGGVRSFRMAIGRANVTRASFDLEVDTGYVVDDNAYIDFTKTGLAFGNVFAENLVPWSIEFRNIRVVWGLAPTDDAANIDRLSRFGGLVEGPLYTTGAVAVGTSLSVDAPGARQFINNTPGLAVTSWTARLSSTPNANTTDLITPNGTAVAASFTAANRGYLGSAFGAVSYGMDGDSAVISTQSYFGAAVPNLIVKIGGTASGTFSAGQLSIPAINVGSASTNLGTTTSTGLSSLGGSNARALWNAAQNMELISTAGTISGVYGPLNNITGSSLEYGLRPLYGYLSVLIAELQARKLL